MDSSTFNIIKSLFFVGMFLLTTALLIPKAISSYLQWKKTQNPKHLSACATALIASLFLVAADLVIIIRTFM